MVQQLFEQYQMSFDALDATKIASLYHLPCAVSDGDGQAVFTSIEQLTEKFEANCKAMSAMEYSHSEFKIVDEKPMGGAAIGVTIAWKVFTKTSDIQFRAFYVCHNVAGQWKIFTVQVFQGTFD